MKGGTPIGNEEGVPTGYETGVPTAMEKGVFTPTGEDGVSIKRGTPIGKEEGVPTEEDGIPTLFPTGKDGAPIP